MKNYERNISIVCPVCGNGQFFMVDSNDVEDLQDAPGDTKIQCSNCRRIFLKSELREENQGILDANINDMKEELSKDIERDIKKRFKKISK